MAVLIDKNGKIVATHSIKISGHYDPERLEPSFARIDEMNVAYEEYKGEFTSFERRGADVPKEDKDDAMLYMEDKFARTEHEIEAI